MIKVIEGLVLITRLIRLFLRFGDPPGLYLYACACMYVCMYVCVGC